MQSNQNLFLAGVAGLVLLAGCNKAPDSATAETDAAAAQAKADEAAAAAETQAREAALAQREAEIAAREATLAAESAKTAAATPPTRTTSGPRPAPVVKPAPAKPASPVVNTPAPAPAPVVLTVPTGTQLSLALATTLSTKTTKVGDAVRARVTQDIRVNDRVAIAAGSTVAGQVTDVVSGSDKIGGVPTLGLRFERLELPGGVDVPIDGTLTQQGKSDTGRDTAKIVGGAAAGAILGHQVKKGDKGKVLGGILGGAIGAVAAQKTGTEVNLVEGTELAITLAAPVEITKR